MPDKELHLSKDLALPIDAVTQTFALLARKGAGKTYGAMVLAEQMLEHDAQVVGLDPVGVWWGLRVAVDGKGKGFDIPVLGGLHGDVPLEPGAGALIADLIVDRGISAILDVSMMRKSDRKKFAVDFAEQLFHRKKAARSPLHLFIEEAQVFVPQRVQSDEARMLGAFEDLVKQGRNFGIGVTLISQRPQAVNKDALNQTECLIVLQTNGAQERKAISDWIVEQSLDVEGLVDELPGLKRGEAWVWSPSWLRKTVKIHIGKKRTFDASATPEIGDKRIAAPRELAPAELEQLRASMKDVVARAEAEDPRKLQAKVRDLEARLKKASAEIPAPAKVERVEVPALGEDIVKRLEAVSSEALLACAQLDSATKEIARVVNSAVATAPPAPPRASPRHVAAAETIKRATRPAPAEPADGEVKLKKGAREMLRVLTAHHSLTRQELGVHTVLGYQTGTFSDYLSALRRAGYLEDDGNRLVATDAGLAATDTQTLRASGDLFAAWGPKLKLGARRMLEALMRARSPVSRAQLGELAQLGHETGTFRDYLSLLRRNGLVEDVGREVQASHALFLEEG